MATDVDIPKRALFKASEVCSIADVQPYVLRSWEAEFPRLGTSTRKDGAKVYRRSDVEMVLRIKELLFSDGLTLGAARRRLEQEPAPEETGDELSLEAFVDQETRGRLAEVKRGLQEIFDLLSGNGERAPSPADAGTKPAPQEIAAVPSRVKRRGQTSGKAAKATKASSKKTGRAASRKGRRA